MRSFVLYLSVASCTCTRMARFGKFSREKEVGDSSVQRYGIGNIESEEQQSGDGGGSWERVLREMRVLPEQTRLPPPDGRKTRSSSHVFVAARNSPPFVAFAPHLHIHLSLSHFPFHLPALLSRSISPADASSSTPSFTLPLSLFSPSTYLYLSIFSSILSIYHLSLTTCCALPIPFLSIHLSIHLSVCLSTYLSPIASLFPSRIRLTHSLSLPLPFFLLSFFPFFLHPSLLALSFSLCLVSVAVAFLSYGEYVE